MKRFLGSPDDYAWDVERKLIWLGTQSYLFRVPFRRYVEEQEAQPSDITIIDDFLCQQRTEWAGLGALDVLAGVLGLASGRRTDLLSWSERHNAVYKVLSGNKERIEVRNAINDREYRLGEHDESYVLEYLLRRHKGGFYRPRYPTLTLVG